MCCCDGLCGLDYDYVVQVIFMVQVVFVVLVAQVVLVGYVACRAQSSWTSRAVRQSRGLCNLPWWSGQIASSDLSFDLTGI